MLGLDTGYFIRLLTADPAAQDVWNRMKGGEVHAAISCLSLFELERQGLKGLIDQRATETLVNELPHLCHVIWLDDPALLRQAARMAHGNGLAMADAIILASFIEAGATEVYTTDQNLKACRGGPRVVML